MRNRAKCKLCQSIIESFHRNDYVTCKCDEISVDGGDYHFRCGAKNWENFIRLDDDDNEIPIEVKEKEDVKLLDNEEMKPPTLTREELIQLLGDMGKRIEELPPEAMMTNINHYDLMSLILILGQIFKAEK